MRERALRVTVVTLDYGPEPTGVAPYVTSLADGLGRRGFEVRVLTTHPHYPAWRIQSGYGGWVRRERHGRVEVHRLRHYVPRVPTPARRLLAEVSFGLRAVLHGWGRPDVVLTVSPGLFSSVPVMLRARLATRRAAAVVWVQDFYSLGIRETGQGGARQASVVAAIEARVLRAATSVVVIHERFREHAATLLGVPRDRIEVVRNWSHVTAVPTGDPSAVRAARGWRSDEVVALHAGSMGRKQGLENLLDVGRLADRRGVPVRIVLLGDGSRRPALQALAAGVRSVQFVDPVADDDEFVRTLAGADVLLLNELPGLREMSVPSKLTSYFAVGRPVVAATPDRSVTAAEIEASGAGVRVPAGDPGAMLDAILRVSSDPTLSRTLGDAGRRYRDDVLVEQAAIDHYAAWLESTAEHGRTRRPLVQRKAGQ